MDLKRDVRIQKAAESASKLVHRACIFDEDESLPELSRWIGVCEELNIEIMAMNKEACEELLEMAIFSELIADHEKSYAILFKNKQFHFFL